MAKTKAGRGPSGKTYVSEGREEKNKERRRARHLKRLEFFAGRAWRKDYNNALRLLSRIEDPSKDTSRVSLDAIDRAKTRVSEHVNTVVQ